MCEAGRLAGYRGKSLVIRPYLTPASDKDSAE